MVDVFTKKKRSEIMSKIRGKWTRPEILAHNWLKGNKIKHRMHPKIYGNPDIITGNKLIFIDGCFWHGCPKHFRIPKSNRKFWAPKIRRNIQRDRKIRKTLRKKGYTVIRIWEHQNLYPSLRVAAEAA